MRVVSSLERLNLHRPIFCNRGSEVNFSLQGPTTAAANSARAFTSFNKTISANAHLVNFTGHKNLFNDGSGSIDIDANLQVSVGLSAVAAGTIVPPKVTQFDINFGMLYRIYQARTSRDND